MMELKKAIIDWLIENKNQWQRVTSCAEHFRPYIFNSDGNYLIGGENVYNFIKAADKLLYGDRRDILCLNRQKKRIFESAGR